MNNSKHALGQATLRSTPSTDFRLGVDIGRVIILGDGPDTSFVGGSDDDALGTPEVPGATQALARLRRELGGRLWLVSKCGARVQARTRRWFAHHAFFEETGIDPTHLFFCRTRPEKGPICARLGITCFVDDRWDILDSMTGVVRHRLLFGATSAPRPDVTPGAQLGGGGSRDPFGASPHGASTRTKRAGT